MVCPPFTHQEAADILRTYGAPGELLTKEQATALNRQARKASSFAASNGALFTAEGLATR